LKRSLVVELVTARVTKKRRKKVFMKSDSMHYKAFY
jgi:hypothetical protein